MQILVFSIFAVIIFLLSVPLHEFSHFLIYKCLGSKEKFKITWFNIKKNSDGSIDIWGRVRALNEEDSINLPDRWYAGNHKLINFIVGLSGGLGVAIVLITIGIFLVLNRPEGFFSYVCIPFFLVAVFQLLYGIGEGLWVDNLQ